VQSSIAELLEVNAWQIREGLLEITRKFPANSGKFLYPHSSKNHSRQRGGCGSSITHAYFRDYCHTKPTTPSSLKPNRMACSRSGSEVV
jgi:hypothetical protein